MPASRRGGIKLAATRLVICLRKQDYTSAGVEIKLSRPTSYPIDLFGPLRQGFDHIYQRNGFYRQTGVVLAGLVPEAGIQYTLFDDPAKIEKMARIYTQSMNCPKSLGNTRFCMRQACPQNCRPSMREKEETSRKG